MSIVATLLITSKYINESVYTHIWHHPGEDTWHKWCVNHWIKVGQWESQQDRRLRVDGCEGAKAQLHYIRPYTNYLHDISKVVEGPLDFMVRIGWNLGRDQALK